MFPCPPCTPVPLLLNAVWDPGIGVYERPQHLLYYPSCGSLSQIFAVMISQKTRCTDTYIHTHTCIYLAKCETIFARQVPKSIISASKNLRYTFLIRNYAFVILASAVIFIHFKNWSYTLKVGLHILPHTDLHNNLLLLHTGYLYIIMDPSGFYLYTCHHFICAGFSSHFLSIKHYSKFFSLWQVSPPQLP